MYNWEVKRVDAANLEKALEAVPDEWDVITVLPATAPDDPDGPLTGRYFLIVARKRK